LEIIGLYGKHFHREDFFEKVLKRPGGREEITNGLI
jgi:hypothetical protein